MKLFLEETNNLATAGRLLGPDLDVVKAIPNIVIEVRTFGFGP
jgi:hypothetical protein